MTTTHFGYIISASGLHDCREKECAFEITDKVTETFTAVPAEGKRFVRWHGIWSQWPTEVCETTISPLSEEHQHLDGDVSLRAQFEADDRLRPWFMDADGDHFGDPMQKKMARKRPENHVMIARDCNDEDPEVRPFVKELEDGRDNNCNGKVDEGFIDIAFYQDRDGDGFGNPEVRRMERTRPEGYVRNDRDCNDRDPFINPEAKEVYDQRDNDCDGETDEGGTRYFRDVDRDGYGTAANFVISLEPVEGYVTSGDDCDDNNPAISPDAEEEFDSVDNDCDGLVDEGFTESEYFRDRDGDGYGDRNDSVRRLEPPSGYVGNSTDNCVNIYNPLQADTDEDGIGDACDEFTDSDDDGVQDSADNCPVDYNPGQQDSDEDGLGDACDSRNDLDPDNDGINSEQDNCPDRYNPSQADRDGDGRGDACDAVDDSTGGGGDSGGSCSMSSEDQAMLDAVNAFRSSAQRCGSTDFSAAPALSWNCQLKQAALAHSQDMANEDFMSHTGSDGSSPGDRIDRTGYLWWTWGENVAAGYSSVSSVVQGWINSSGHCANMMNPNFTNLGAAKFSNSSSQYGIYWTQVFGRPR